MKIKVDPDPKLVVKERLPEYEYSETVNLRGDRLTLFFEFHDLHDPPDGYLVRAVSALLEELKSQ